jgi:hypothetical protein
LVALKEAVMALDASSVLGSPQLAGVKVNPRGAGRTTAAASIGLGGGIVGAAIGAGAGMKAGQKQAGIAAASETPAFGRLAYLAVTESELALIKLKSGMVTVHLDEVIVRVGRSAVASSEMGGGISPSLTITFGDGGSWQLEVPRPSKKHAQEVIHALGGHAGDRAASS